MSLLLFHVFTQMHVITNNNCASNTQIAVTSFLTCGNLQTYKLGKKVMINVIVLKRYLPKSQTPGSNFKGRVQHGYSLKMITTIFGSTLRRSTRLWFSSDLVILQGVLSTGFTLYNCVLCNHGIIWTCLHFYCLFRFVTAFFVPCIKQPLKYFCCCHFTIKTSNIISQLTCNSRLNKINILRQNECEVNCCLYKKLNAKRLYCIPFYEGKSKCTNENQTWNMHHIAMNKVDLYCKKVATMSLETLEICKGKPPTPHFPFSVTFLSHFFIVVHHRHLGAQQWAHTP